MRYHFIKPEFCEQYYGKTYKCNHPYYNTCTLYEHNGKGIAIVQLRYDNKKWYYSEVDDYLANAIYMAKGFMKMFKEHAKEPVNGLYPTFTVRQVMWHLRLNPIPKQSWESHIFQPL